MANALVLADSLAVVPVKTMVSVVKVLNFEVVLTKPSDIVTVSVGIALDTRTPPLGMNIRYHSFCSSAIANLAAVFTSVTATVGVIIGLRFVVTLQEVG